MYCSNCGKKNPKDSKFCQFCGIKYGRSETVDKSSEHKTTNTGAWFFIIVVVLMILGAIYVFANSSNSNPTNSLPSLPTNETDTTTTDTTADFKTNYRNAFIQSCIQEGGTDSSIRVLCTCTANYLVSNYTVNQLTNMDEKYSSTGVLPQEIYDAANTCGLD